jgi:hypothetical protein
VLCFARVLTLPEPKPTSIIASLLAAGVQLADGAAARAKAFDGTRCHHLLGTVSDLIWHIEEHLHLVTRAEAQARDLRVEQRLHSAATAARIKFDEVDAQLHLRDTAAAAAQVRPMPSSACSPCSP